MESDVTNVLTRAIGEAIKQIRACTAEQLRVLFFVDSLRRAAKRCRQKQVEGFRFRERKREQNLPSAVLFFGLIFKGSRSDVLNQTYYYHRKNKKQVRSEK